jgi:pyruvate kinase
VKEFMDNKGKVLDKACSVNLSEESVKGIKPTEAELKEEITRFKAQTEKLVNKINQIRNQKEQEIQNMIEKNKIAFKSWVL